MRDPQRPHEPPPPKPRFSALATTLAAFAAFFLTPYAHAFSIEFIAAFVKAKYGIAWPGFISPLWWIASAVLVFFVAQALLPYSFKLFDAEYWLRRFRRR